MLAARIDSVERLDELESHLRDEIEARVRSGIAEQAAFESARLLVGRPEVLKPEFAKVRETVYERMKRLYYRLAGIQNYQLATNMNTSNQNLESRWATYAKSAAIIVPAIFVWAGFCIYVLPKLRQVCDASGMVVWRPVMTAMALTDFIRINFIVMSVLVIAALTLLEWRSDWWRRYRRPVLGVAAYSFNVLVLALMAALAVLAVAAAAHLMPGR